MPERDQSRRKTLKIQLGDTTIDKTVSTGDLHGSSRLRAFELGVGEATGRESLRGLVGWECA